MPIGLVSNLNLVSSFGLLRAVRTKHTHPLDLRKALIFARNPNPIVSSGQVLRTPSKFNMEVSGSILASGDMVVDSLVANCGNLSGFVKPSGVFYSHRGYKMCQRAKVSIRSLSGTSCYYGGQGSLLCSEGRSVNSGRYFSKDFYSCRTFSSSCYNDGIVPEVSRDESLISEQLSSIALSDKKNPSHNALKLQSGVCYMPHPAKVETGGEDAYFICEDEQVIGVADGVGGWADVGVNAGNYSRELMSNSVKAIRESSNGNIDPLKVLEKAHLETKAMGSSTACIIALRNKGLHAINLGDSGFIVVRDGNLIFESPVQQHGFNFTYQLERSDRSDLPSSGQIFEIPVVSGDVIVAGSDGLFDNLFSQEVATIVSDAVNESLSPDDTAQKIAVIARERALDQKRRTPFAVAAQEAGFAYYGGKLDDLTVVVSYVSTSTNA